MQNSKKVQAFLKLFIAPYSSSDAAKFLEERTDLKKN